MAKSRDRFACSECGTTMAKWAGRCAVCGAMNSIVEMNANEVAVQARGAEQKRAASGITLEALAAPGSAEPPRLASGIAELDRVCGGGLAAGSCLLVGGEPGIGKSTLLVQASAGWSLSGSVAYLTAEESVAQVRARCQRLQLMAPKLKLAAVSDAEAVAGLIRSGEHRVVVLDSIQTVRIESGEGVAGSASQVRAAAALLVEAAKTSGVSLVLVGQVTKDGTLAGPRMLEHLVDTVLSFEGDRYHELRTLRAVKNRFGSTNELGLFRMGGTGLEEVADPGGVFIAHRSADLPGSCVVPALEGNRCLLLEVQALVNPTEAPQPARRVAGCDSNRVAMVLAVLTRRLRLPLGNCDVFVNVTGGARIIEPAADLGIALALASAWREVPIPADLVAVGEVGLGGELRPANRYELRATEARRLGFKRLIGPGGGSGRGRLVVEGLSDALDRALGTP